MQGSVTNTTLYEIAEDFEKLLGFIDEQTDPDNPEAMGEESMLEALSSALAELEMSLADKTENIVRLIAGWDSMIDMIKAEETRLRDKRKALENKKARLRTYLADQMQRVGQKKVETSVKNAHLRQGSESVVIDDEFALPEGTYDTEMIIKPDRAVLKKRLKDGEDTPGAHLERGATTVMFR